MINRTPISKKNKKPVQPKTRGAPQRTDKSADDQTALAKWQRAGTIFDQRAKRHMSSHHVGYEEALRVVLRRDPKLWRVYDKTPVRDDHLKDLRSLANFLNQGEGPKRNSLRAELGPVIGWNNSKVETVKEAAERLAEKLGRLQTHWNLLHVNAQGRPFFTWSSPGDWYGIIAHAIQFGRFSKLKQCRECQSFFVTEDHRRDYCHDKCFRSHEADRVKSWRSKQA